MAVKSPEQWMRRAILLSRRGFPAPNPRVGCVIVRNGEIVGEGFHAYAGGPHAEIVALERAAAKAKGADVYVTLEPCAHQGRTPPCAHALIAAGVRRVFAASLDPNPKASGGLNLLLSAGIAADVGLLAEEAEAANRTWMSALQMGRPYVALKAAISLDGRVALPSGESRWITGPAARRAAHRLRAELGAVLVGCGTVLLDDPRLTARIAGVRNQPVRIVLDPQGRLKGTEAPFRQPGETLWVAERARSPSQVACPSKDGNFDLRALLAILWERGITGVLVEGGPTTIARFVEARLVDCLHLFVAPKVIGGGPHWLPELEGPSLEGALPLSEPKVRRLGQDLWIQIEVQRADRP